MMMEDLKALSVAVSDGPQILDSDPLTGAKTVYYKLELKVATTPARYRDIAACASIFNRGRVIENYLLAFWSNSHKNNIFSLVKDFYIPVIF